MNSEKLDKAEIKPGLNGFILAAGLGTRMLDLTKTTPKPLLKFKGKCLIDYSLELMQKWKIEECVINLYYYPDQIIEHVDQWLADTQNPFIVRYSLEEELLGTAGGIRTGLSYFSFADKPIVVLNPDTLIIPDIHDYPMQSFGDSDETRRNQNRSSGISANSSTIESLLYLLPLEEGRNESWFEFSDTEQKSNISMKSLVSEKDEYRPLNMIPKGSVESVSIGNTRYYYIGYSIINPDLFKNLEINKKVELGPLWKAAADNGRLYGKIFKGSLIDMGTKEAYLGAVAE
jgi:NDP-sugar pyrophosphorylase family protein